ncbi:hypothetical protein [Acetobacter conturbans]|nr:hypothetical protein [Acetobacter conturbans]
MSEAKADVRKLCVIIILPVPTISVARNDEASNAPERAAFTTGE